MITGQSMHIRCTLIVLDRQGHPRGGGNGHGGIQDASDDARGVVPGDQKSAALHLGR